MNESKRDLTTNSTSDEIIWVRDSKVLSHLLKEAVYINMSY